MKAATTAASLLTACILSTSVAAQAVDPLRTLRGNNRYLAASLGLATQNYREQDQYGHTQNGVLNRESGKQNTLELALRWQFASRIVTDVELNRHSGPTDYDGYLQSGNGNLSPYNARTGNVATQYSAGIGFAVDTTNWAAMPEAWQMTPLLQLSNHHWQRNLVQYGETYSHRSQALGTRIQWATTPSLTLEVQALFGKTYPANVSVPDLGFAAQQSAGKYRQQHLAASYTITKDWRVQAKYAQSHYNHGASPVVAGLQAPPNEHRPSSWSLGLQRLF